MAAPTLHLTVDWVHIREAERLGRRVTPLALALGEQTRFQAGQLMPEAIVLFDSLSGEPVRYAPHPDIAAYNQRFVKGQPVEPAAFVLEPLSQNDGPTA